MVVDRYLSDKYAILCFQLYILQRKKTIFNMVSGKAKTFSRKQKHSKNKFSNLSFRKVCLFSRLKWWTMVVCLSRLFRFRKFSLPSLACIWAIRPHWSFPIDHLCWTCRSFISTTLKNYCDVKRRLTARVKMYPTFINISSQCGLQIILTS